MSYKIDRVKFIDYMLRNKEDILANTEEMKYDLKVGGEFIVTATGLLSRCGSIPVHILESYTGDYDFVEGSECELIYKEPFE